MKQSKAQSFADTLKDNPKEIIAWAKREIAEYEKLPVISKITGKEIKKMCQSNNYCSEEVFEDSDFCEFHCNNLPF